MFAPTCGSSRRQAGEVQGRAYITVCPSHTRDGPALGCVGGIQEPWRGLCRPRDPSEAGAACAQALGHWASRSAPRNPALSTGVAVAGWALGRPARVSIPRARPHAGPYAVLTKDTMPQTYKRKRSWSRAVFSNLQRKGLEKRFEIQKYVTKPDRKQLAAMLGLTDAQVSALGSRKPSSGSGFPGLEGRGLGLSSSGLRRMAARSSSLSGAGPRALGVYFGLG